MTKQNDLDLLKGDLIKTIIKLGYPMALASALHTLFNFADTFWLGKLGRHAMSAPVISFHIIFFIISIGIGFSITATSLVSQYIGANEKEKAHKTTGNILTYNFIFSIFFSLLGFCFAEPLLHLLKTPADTFQCTLTYLRIVLLGMPLTFPFFVFQAALNGYGDTITPLKIELISIGINIILDPLLIFGWLGFPKLGVMGAAITTIFSRALSSAIGVYYLFSGKKGIKITLSSLKPDLKLLPLMMKIGIPASLGMSGTSLGFLVILGIVNKFGTAVISAYGIATRVVHIFMMPAMGISHALTAIIGQNLGACNIERAKKAVRKGIKLMAGYIVPTMCLAALIGRKITIFFIPDDPTVHQIGETMFFIVSPSLIFYGLTVVFNGAFQGGGHTIPVMLTNIARIWLLRIPLVYIISMVILEGPQNLKASDGIWWGMFFSNLIAMFIIFLWYRRGSWCKSQIHRDISTDQQSLELQSLE